MAREPTHGDLALLERRIAVAAFLMEKYKEEAVLKKRRILFLLIFCCLLAAEVGIALFINDTFIRPYVGDMLVTLLLCCMCRVIVPNKIQRLPLFVFLFAACVEISQYFDFVALLGLADNRMLSIALGRTFSWIDIACYAVGCAAAFLLDKIIIKNWEFDKEE